MLVFLGAPLGVQVQAQAQPARMAVTAGALFGFPLVDGASATPAFQLQLVLEQLRPPASRSSRFVAEALFHPRIIPADDFSFEAVTRLFGIGYDVRFPVGGQREGRAGAQRIAVGVRSYLLFATDSDDPVLPVLLTMPRVSYEYPFCWAKVCGGAEAGVQYLGFVNFGSNKGDFVNFLFPLSLNLRF